MGEDHITKYFELMAGDGRFFQIMSKNQPLAFVTFSICNDYKPYENKDIWDYLPHNPNGKICYVEKMAAISFSMDLLRKIEEVIVTQYPQIEGAVWMRPGSENERKVYYRRRYYEASLRN